MSVKRIEELFTPVIHREEGSYWAEIPAMPGCFTAADSLAELKGNLIEAMQCWLLTRNDLAARALRRSIRATRAAKKNVIAKRKDNRKEERQ